MSEQQTPDRPSTAHEALEALRAGHARFHAREVHGERPPHADSLEMWRETQSPWATIVACSDSRVSPEIVFDATMGELFVIRTAGQTLDGASLGTIEYGVAHLGTPIVLVLGHTGCGAVMAALGDGDPPPPLCDVVRPIRDSVPAGTDPADAVRINARARAADVRRLVPGVRSSAGCLVTSAIFDLHDGSVAWLDD